jgi:uncharacterized membrane protein
MKSRTWILITAVYLFVLAMPVSMTAQDNPSQDHKPKHHTYKLIDMGTLGGPNGYLAIDNGVNGAPNQVVNNRGAVAAWADTSTPDPNPASCFNPDCFVSHAFKWQNGVLTDLGTLAAGWSSSAAWISDPGLIAGQSQNAVIDPLVPGFSELRAVFGRTVRSSISERWGK